VAKAKTRATRVGQLIDMRPRHVANGDNRKTQTIGLAISGQTARPGGPHARPQNIGANHEKPFGINGLSRSHHLVPPPRLAGNRVAAGNILVAGGGMANQNRIIARRV